MTPTHLNVVIIIFASIDVVLEPYFLFLIIRKSSPGMRIYRVFLILISLSNFIFSISFFVDSPTMFLTQSYLFIVSSTLSPIYAWFLWQFEMSFLAIQLQFSLLMVIYASYEITHPIKGLNLKSKWLWLFSLVFILGPAFGYVACNYKARVTYEYYNFSPSGSGYTIISHLVALACLLQFSFFSTLQATVSGSLFSF
ncbi:hypothetical protein L596_020129 [Steinernema carpocapsae]|uniref:Serpentine receptor class gamma n=1 Tax=Steinernema carpocapsae TaxID=34508 RepID=A0A4U5MTA2_STECR|nr:hypothetical protein L596_020129 [Steinernema carpocapsae]